MRGSRAPDLIDLAFEGRNKEYGAYYLRKKYGRYLAISLLCGVSVLFLAVLVPFWYYYLEPGSLIEGGVVYEVGSYSMMPPPDAPDISLPSMAKPLQEENVIPEVADSVKPEEVKPIVQTEEKKVERDTVDSSGSAKSNSGMGPGTGESSGLTTVIDVYPRFPGGDESRLYYIRKNTKYPEAALKGIVQGVVMVVFIVELDGALSHIEVSKGIGGGCDEEALRVIRSMPRWEPAKRAGRPVRVMLRVPILFRIPGK